MSEKEYLCRYCGRKAMKYATICSGCSKKLKLVRKLLKMVKDTAEEIKRGNNNG